MVFPTFKFTTKVKGVSAKTMRAASKKALAAAAKYWHQFLLPKHFTRAGAIEYGYENRTKKYMIRKAKIRHHQDPLVWSGSLKRAASMVRDIRSTSKAGKVVMKNLPRHVFYYKPTKPIHKERELVMVSRRDERALTAFFENHLFKELNRSSKIRNIAAPMTGGVIPISA